MKRWIKALAWRGIYGIVAAGCRLNRPRLTALAWRWSLIRAPKMGRAPEGAARVIVLDKIGGTDDLAAAYRGVDPAFDFFLLRRKLVRLVFDHFLDERTKHYNYLSTDPGIELRKRAYRAFLKGVVADLHARWPFAGALSFNVSYAPERELAAAMTELGLAFVVCHKECVKTPAKHRLFTVAYRERVGRFTGSHICVYNEAERASMVAAGLATPGQISVVGSPRVDLAHAMRCTTDGPEGPATILYYTIYEQAGLPYADKEWVPDREHWYQPTPVTWAELARRTSEYLLAFAIAHPDTRLIVKAKQGNEAESRRLWPAELPANVTFVAGGIGHTLLPHVGTVVAFNSVSLLEALAAGRRVVVPMFGVDGIPEADKFVYQLDDAVVFVRNADELNTALLSSLRRRQIVRELHPAVRRVLDRYLGNADGAAGSRLRDYLRSTIRSSTTPRARASIRRASAL